MNRKKLISLILALGVIGGINIYLNNYSSSAAVSSDKNIKIMAYKASAKANENGYQIDKYENIQGADWISDNEILTLTKKGEFKNPDSTTPIRYCSIYNLNTKKSKDFKDVNIDEFMGVSPDKKYVLYAEARTIPKIGGDEWQKALDSGDLLHKNVKLLNLSTGEIMNVDTEKINSDAQFIWVSNNKILSNYFEKWSIIDTTGKVYTTGEYTLGKLGGAWISGTDDIKDLGNNVEGKFYCTQHEHGKEGVKLCTVDVKTKEIKTIFSNQYSLNADKKGKAIIIDNFVNGEKSPDGIFKDRTFGAFILDETGKVQKDIRLPKGKLPSYKSTADYVLSPDGSKAAYVEMSGPLDPSNDNSDPCVKIIDTKTGSIKEIVNTSSIKDKSWENYYRIVKHATVFNGIDKDSNNIDNTIKEKKELIKPFVENIRWDSTDSSLFFTYGIRDLDNTTNNSSINTYLVTFDN